VKNKRVILGIGVTACISVSSFFYFQYSNDSRNLSDQALLSIIKNDQRGFENFLASGGKIGTAINVEGGTYTVGELLVKYNRLAFVKFAKDKKMPFDIDPKKEFDVHSLSVNQNNSEILGLLLGDQKLEKNFKSYGDKGWSLIHMASAECSYKVIGVLHKAGMNWNLKSKRGDTPLTVAAEAGCLQALSFFKEQGADFRENDGRGLNALSILSKQKDAALMAFAESFIERRTPASVTSVVTVTKEVVPNFYKKRHIPKDNIADRAHLIEPEDRPDEANETAENSEFSD
jgi:hypothetical protein